LKDYSNAKTEFKKVIDSGMYKLTANYGDNFTVSKENNSESLFEIQFVSDGNEGWGGDAAGVGKGQAFIQDLAPAGYTGQDGIQINKWALDLMLNEKTVNGETDPRTFETFFWDTDATTKYQGKTLSSRTYLGKTYKQAYTDGRKNIYVSKHLDFTQGFSDATKSWHMSGNNLRLMRYADVLLMYAEAEVGGWEGNKSTQAAVDAINLVRKRADMPTYTTVTMQNIADERVKELSLERSRYHDILRWGKVVDWIVKRPELKSSSSGTGAYQPGREYIDIPQNEINANPNFKHNPGY
jgi:starch-binding outer membrane protein, SusD/RagB family